jgi:hypothetical protein
MNATISKVLIPNKEWIIENSGKKIGSIAKNKKGYVFIRNGQIAELKSYKDVVETLATVDKKKFQTFEIEPLTHTIYNYPCRCKPYNPLYDVKNKLPLYTKNLKSKSRYCAGYYVIQFQKGWLRSFCPKLITLERNPYQGPFKTAQEMKTVLNGLNKTCDN